MPKLQIDGVGTVEVGDEFMKLDAAGQQSYVNQLHSQLGGASPAQAQPQEGGWMDTAKDVAKSTGQGLFNAGLSGLSSIVGLPFGKGDLAETFGNFGGIVAEKAVGAITGNPVPEGLFRNKPSAVSSEGIKQAMGMQDYQPKTMGGSFAKTVGEFAPLAMTPGSALTKAANVGIPSLLTETAGQSLKGTPYEQPARLATGLLTTALTGKLTAKPEAYLASQTRNVSKAQWNDAFSLMSDAKAKGIALTVDEAVQSVTGGATSLSQVRHFIDNASNSRPVMANAMAERAPAIENAARSSLDQIAPSNAQPSALGPRLQDAAMSSIDMARQQGNKIAEPFYDGMKGQRADVASLMQDPAYAEALTKLRGNPILNQKVRGLPDDDVSVVNEAMKLLKTMSANAKPSAMNPQGNNQLSAAYSSAYGKANNTARAASPEFGQARDIVANWNKQAVDPLRAGPLGRIAETDDVLSQAGILTKPVAGGEGEISRAMTRLNAASPQDAKSLVRLTLEQKMNSAFGTTSKGGQDAFAGAKFAGSMRKDAQTSKNINAAIEAVTDKPTAENIDRLTDILGATGFRPQGGSMTAFNEELKDMFGGSTMRTLARGWNAPRAMFEQANMSRMTKGLADFLLSGPDGVQKLGLLSQNPGGSGILSALVSGRELASDRPKAVPYFNNSSRR